MQLFRTFLGSIGFFIVLIVAMALADGTLTKWWNMPPRPVIVGPIDPDSELSHLMYDAGKASRAGDHARAAELLTKALAIEPGPNVISQDLHERRGNEYDFLNMFEKAYGDYDAAIRVYYYKMSEHAIRSYIGRGYASLHLEKFKRAKDDFDVVLKELPSDVPRSSATLAWRGGAWQGLGDRMHAVADYKAALALDPQNGYARRNLKALGED